MQISPCHRQVVGVDLPLCKLWHKRMSEDLLVERRWSVRQARNMVLQRDTPHWQLVQECSVVRANHRKACSEDVEASICEFMSHSYKKKGCSQFVS